MVTILIIYIANLKYYLGTIFMYGQTGSGKTFTMMGSNSYTCSNMSSSFHDVTKQETSVTPRGHRYDNTMSTDKIPFNGRVKTLSAFDGNNLLESSRMLFKAHSSRTKSPMISRDKTPRRTEKSPIKISKEKLATPSKHLDQFDIENKMNIEETNAISNLHKRASTLNFASFGPVPNEPEILNSTNSIIPHPNTNTGANGNTSIGVNISTGVNTNISTGVNTNTNNYFSNNSVLNQKPKVDNNSIIEGVSNSEQETIQSCPENGEGILVLGLKDIFAKIEEVFISNIYIVNNFIL